MEVDHPTRKVGYNPKLFINQKAIQKYICCICNYVLRTALQIPQSVDPKRACEDCYKSNTRYVRTTLYFFEKTVAIVSLKVFKLIFETFYE